MLAEKRISRTTRGIERQPKTSPFKAHHHLTSGRREIHWKKVNEKNGFEIERILLSHYATVPSYRDIKFESLSFA